MKLVEALSLENPIQIAFAGAGGKTSAMFRLARQLRGPVFVTTSTHLGLDQVALADQQVIVTGPDDLEHLLDPIEPKITLFTGPETADGRASGLSEASLASLQSFCASHEIPLLVEADGARGLPLKAPAEHEPAIPAWVNAVIYMAGMSGIDRPLTNEFVHRPERFSRLSGLKPGEAITTQALAAVLSHPAGGLKNIPGEARHIALLNQADTIQLQIQAGQIAEKINQFFDSALIGTMNDTGDEIKACYQPIAGIILAAGGSTRYGQSKPLLTWHGKPFIRQVAETVLLAGLNPVLVITGFQAEQVEAALSGLPVRIIRNSQWMEGQSTSVKAGLKDLPPRTGAAIFLLADQPQVSPAVITSLMEQHRQKLPPIIAPLVEGKRANPVLFDRKAFSDLASISGDVGGRQVFSKFHVSWLEWNDSNLLLDVDTPEDYEKLQALL